MQQEEEQAELRQLQQARLLELQKRALIKQILDPQAYERLANIRAANHELYEQLVNLLISLYQQGQIRKLSEEQLKALVNKLIVERRHETKITRLNK